MDRCVSLREAEFRDLFSIGDFLAAGHRAFRLYGEGDLVNPPRTETIERREGLDFFRLEMPAEWAGRYRARKIVEEYSQVDRGRLGQRRTFILLEDLVRGRMARLDADYITDMRTGAAGALGVRYLARGPVTQVGILGTGRIGRSLALAVDRLFPLEEIRVTSRSAENRRAFALQVGPQLRARLRLATDLESCVRRVDAILTAVPTPQPIVRLDHLDERVCLAVIGGDSRTRQVAAEVLEQIGVLVDHLDQARESGEFRHALETGRFARIGLTRRADGEVLDIGDAACGRLEPGRDWPRLAYFTGMAAQDLCAAAMVYERCAEGEGTGTRATAPGT
jgi:alanine dehydrogenase